MFEARARLLIESDDPAIGLVCLMPVGMVEVSSCVIHADVRPGQRIQKGEEVGYFQYGGSTYRIIGYGLSSLFLKAGLADNRYSSYPFVWLLILVWLPVTVWLLWQQRREARMWTGAVSFAVSMFVLLFISRVFQTSYLVWPLTGIIAAALLANADDEHPRARADVAGEVDGRELQPVAPGT